MRLRSLLFLAVVLLFASCSKEDLATTVTNDEITLMGLVMGDEKGDGKEEKDYEEKENCLALVYPVTVTMPDDSSLTGADEEDLWDAIKAWYEANPNADERPSFVYPLEVIIPEGTTETVNSEDELKSLFEYCGEEEGSCYEYLLPLTVIMPDGSSIAINGETDWEQVRSWYEANPDEEDKFTFEFPVEVKVEDGEILTIEGQEGINDLEKLCEGERKDCVEYVLPISMTLPDGTTVTINEEGDWQMIEDWYDANPDIEERPALIFPVDIYGEDGAIITVANEDELKDLAGECYEEGEKDCFEWVLPISWTMPDGSSFTVAEEADWEAFNDWFDLNPGYEGEPVLEYPVTVIFPDESTQTVNDEAEMDALKADCEG